MCFLLGNLIKLCVSKLFRGGSLKLEMCGLNNLKMSLVSFHVGITKFAQCSAAVMGLMHTKMSHELFAKCTPSLRCKFKMVAIITTQPSLTLSCDLRAIRLYVGVLKLEHRKCNVGLFRDPKV